MSSDERDDASDHGRDGTEGEAGGEDRAGGRSDATAGADDWWRRYVEDEQWHRWYRKDFDRRYGRSFADPENACAAAIEKLLVRLPNMKLKSRSNLDALVRVAFRNIGMDLVYAEHGKIRAPLRMRKLGPPIVRIFHLFCLERKPQDVIAEELQLSSLSVREWVLWLKEARKCPERPIITNTQVARPGEPPREIELADEGAGPDPTADGAERDELAALLRWLLAPGDGGADESPLTGALRGRLDSIRSALALDDDERLMLRMAYLEELAPKEIASLLGMEVHTVRRRQKALLARIRGGFEGLGLGL